MAKKSVVKNYIFNLIYQLLSLVLPLVTTPYLSRVLGSEQIGIYGYTLSIVTYFVLFGSLGIAMYGQREIAYVQNNKEERSKAFFEIVLVRFITLFVSLVIFYFTFGIKGDYAIYYRIFSLYIVSNAFDISWLYQGIEEFGKTVIRNLLVKISSLILIFACVKTQNDLSKYIFIFVISELLGNATMWMYLPKYIQKVKIKELNFKVHIKPTLLLFLPQVATQIYTVLDKTMVGLITGNMNEVGFYEQAQKVVRAALIIITALGTVMASRIAAIYAQNKKEEVQQYLKKSFNFVWFLGLPMMFGLIVIADKFVPWFYGSGFEPVTSILIATSPILIAIGLNNVVGVQYLIQVKKQNKFTIAVTIGAISNVIFNFIFIKLFNATGAAIASVISEIIILLVEIWYTKNEIDLKSIFEAFPKYFIATIVMSIMIFICERKLDVSAINTFIEIIIGAIVYAISLILLKDEYFLSYINKAVSEVKKYINKIYR